MAAPPTDIRRAAAELRSIVGDMYVIHRPEDLIVFEYDGSVDRAMPQLVVLPASTDEVSRVLETALRYGLPVVARGAGTGLSGGAVAEEGGIVLALTRMKRILEIDSVNQHALTGETRLHSSANQDINRHRIAFTVIEAERCKLLQSCGRVADQNLRDHVAAPELRQQYGGRSGGEQRPTDDDEVPGVFRAGRDTVPGHFVGDEVGQSVPIDITG